ncbi:PTS system cellobiose-specific IIC component [Erysipelotrichaceae bacterium]|nr:PTS system cellobiose-specific IIC component [Erysipelotrichaceae bacterium]
MKKMEAYLNKIGGKLGTQRHLQALSAGMMMVLPLIVIGAIFMVIANPPINPDLVDATTANFFIKFLLNWKSFAVANYGYLTAPFDLTMGIFGLMSAFTIAYQLAKSYALKVDAVIIALTAFVVFFLVCSAPVVEGTVSIRYLGADGLFTAILISFAVVEIFHFAEIRGWLVSFPSSVPPMVTGFVNALLPVVGSIILLYGLNLILVSNFDKNIPAAITGLLTPGLGVVNNIWVYIAIVIFSNLLWLVGINGTSIVFPIVFSIGIANTGVNAEAVMSGGEATMVMNLQMFRYMILGGAGNTLGLVMLMMFSKSVQLKAIGRLSFIPGICGINEPVIFGVPVVFNPILAIPFLLMPVISVGLGYFVQVVGLVRPGYIVDPSFTPFFAQAYLSALDWRNIVFVCILVGLSVIVYFPFFKILEKQLVAKEQ